VNIYVASSWRNVWQQPVVRMLRKLKHTVYDYRAPEAAFPWKEVDPDWQDWPPAKYREMLKSPLAEKGFAADMGALRVCDACIAVQPYGTSASWEIGWAAGAGKRTAVFYPLDVEVGPKDALGHSMCGAPCSVCGDLDGCWMPGKLARVEPELMVKGNDALLLSTAELLAWVKS
jgi:hypothetical protein